MPTKNASAVAEVPPATDVATRKTYTRWDAFEKARVVPTTIICDVIRLHPADEACKTRLALEAKNLISHAVELGHGGGFQVKVKQTEGKSWPGWSQLAEAGMEIVQLKCEVCDKQVQISPRDIANHLRPHQGKFRGAYQNYRDTFFLQIQNTPVVGNDDEFNSDDSE